MSSKELNRNELYDLVWSKPMTQLAKEFGMAYKRLILSHHKHLNKGDYIIDDRTKNGVEHFEGEHIHFGTEQFPDWDSVCGYLVS